MDARVSIMIVRHFLRWVKTAPAGERADATSALARAYLYSDLDMDDRQAAEAALLILLDDPSPLVRLALADAFAEHRRAPVGVILALANEPGEIGAIVLSRSPVLSDGELVEMLAEANPLRQSAIAARERLPAPVAAAIAESGCSEACLTLIENAGADVPGFALGRIVARFGHLPALREALLARSDLPAEAHQALIRSVADTLSAFVVQCEWLPPEQAARVSREACEKATVVLAEDRATGELRALVEHLRGKGQLTPGLVLRSLLSGHVRLFLEAVSLLSGLPTAKVAALAADRSGGAFRALYDKVGLPRGAYLAFRTALQVVQRENYLDDRTQPSGLKRRIVERVLEEYAKQPAREELGHLLAALRRWQMEAAREEARALEAGLVADVDPVIRVEPADETADVLVTELAA
ncbi:DUF2336 domain-containing protein [Bosea sp. 117]|uniref:DUF2336 domain-containing protein n=1 Tax=Bosea sp. 117 TaxID=1125973 RepID=UPI000A71FACE|nr:DUF2336 domain-containing protein [Bosea sp. 117]